MLIITIYNELLYLLKTKRIAAYMYELVILKLVTKPGLA